MANGVSYQLTAGPLRRVNYTDCDEQLYYAYENLIDEHDESTVICVPAEGYHRTLFVNPNALDYISIPSHVLERGSDEISNELIESLPDDDDKPIKQPRRKRVNLTVVAKAETAANEKKINR